MSKTFLPQINISIFFQFVCHQNHRSISHSHSTNVFFFSQMHYLIPLKCWLCAQIYSFAHNNAIQTLYLFTRRSMNISFATKTHCLFSRSASTYQIQMPSPPPRPPQPKFSTEMTTCYCLSSMETGFVRNLMANKSTS